MKKRSKKGELLALFPQALYRVQMPEKSPKTSKNGLVPTSCKPNGGAGRNFRGFSGLIGPLNWQKVLDENA